MSSVELRLTPLIHLLSSLAAEPRKLEVIKSDFHNVRFVPQADIHLITAAREY